MRLPLGDCPLLRPCLGPPPPDLAQAWLDLVVLALIAAVVVGLFRWAGMGGEGR